MRKLLIVALFVILLALTASASFADMPDNWSRVALQAALDNGLMEGDNGYIRPDSPLTRAEMATVIVRALGATKTSDISCFTDVTKDKWYYTPMSCAVAMGAFNGDGNTLRPDDPITREEAFTVMARVFCLSSQNTQILQSFKDSSDVSDWSAAYLSALAEKGYIKGYDGYLDPKKNITRAEFAQLMYNTVNTYITDSRTQNVSGNAVVKNAVTLRNMTFDGDVIIADGVVGAVKLENVTVNGRLIFRAGDGSSLDGAYKSVILWGDGIAVTVTADTTVIEHTLVGKDSSLTFKKNQTKPTPDIPEVPEITETPEAPKVEDDNGDWSGWYD